MKYLIKLVKSPWLYTAIAVYVVFLKPPPFNEEGDWLDSIGGYGQRMGIRLGMPLAIFVAIVCLLIPVGTFYLSRYLIRTFPFAKKRRY